MAEPVALPSLSTPSLMLARKSNAEVEEVLDQILTSATYTIANLTRTTLIKSHSQFNLSNTLQYLNLAATISMNLGNWPVVDPLLSYGRGRELLGRRHKSLIYGPDFTDVIIIRFSILEYPSYILQGLSGQPFSGPDLRGFAGNATPRIFGRWMDVDSLFPFCKGHSEKGTNDHEPWSFGEEIGSQLPM
ncbi:putative glucan 1,3-alpha-glucosidase [Arachis hypogaea]|nr:putative glucan 1,3-alpha-glucosidase [Arachis hypogaea]